MIKAGIDINAQDSLNRAAIHISAQHGTSKVADLLVKSKANLNLRDSIRSSTPFDYARRSNHRKVFEDVLKKNGKIAGWNLIEDDTDALLEAANEGIITDTA